MPRVLFTADVHGNAAHVRAVVRHAEACGCDAVLLGGDLSPRRSKLVAQGAAQTDDAAVAAQGAWLRAELAPLLRTSRVPVYLIFGNSDCAVNYAPLKAELEAAAPHCRCLWNEAVTLGPAPQDTSGPVALFGCPLVPPSNHKLKDQERFDISEAVDRINRGHQPIVAVGVGSAAGTLTPLSLHDHAATLQHELDVVLTAAERQGRSMAHAIWMVHSPPHGGHADRTKLYGHVGSVAIREAIERYQPLATLHGHIHETVTESDGVYLGHLGRTVVLAVGNNFHAPDVACILLDTADPDSAQRLLLPAVRDDNALASAKSGTAQSGT